MRTRTAALGLIVAVALAALAGYARTATAADFPEKWVYGGGSVGDDSAVESLIAFMKEAKALGVTHIQLNDGGMAGPDRMTPGYEDRVKKVLAAAKEMNITDRTRHFAIGYSGRYLGRRPRARRGYPGARYALRHQGRRRLAGA